MNPELRRQLWLELSLNRLILTPMVLAVLFAIVLIDEPASERAGLLRNAGVGFYMALLGAWGTRRAVASMADEVRGHTWDIQRMSALGAWPLAWGKLFGGTVIVWYAGLLCLGVAAFGELRLGGWETALILIVALIAGGILALATALATYLLLLRGIGRVPGIAFCQVAGLGAVAAVGMTLGGLVPPPWAAAAPVMLWFGVLPMSGGPVAAVLAGFAAWAVLAVYRLMRHELQYASWPVVLPVFCLSATVYLMGVTVDQTGAASWGEIHGGPAIGFFVVLTATYLTLFAEAKDSAHYRAIGRTWQQGAWSALFARLPLWAPALVLVFVTAGAAEWMRIRTPGLPAVVGTGESGWAGHGGFIAMALFLLRDVLIVHFAHYGRAPSRRADGAALVYLAILYGLVPLLILAATQGDSPLVALFWPVSILAVVFALAEVLAMIFLLRVRIVRRRRAAM